MEEWKDVKGFEGYYMVSNSGNVKSLDRFVTVTKKNGYKFLRKMKGKVLTPSVHSQGYLNVTMRCDGIKNKRIYVHRLVAQTFISNPENKYTVNHKNGIKTDNRVENLEWCTLRENLLHGYRTGLLNQTGVNHSQARLTEKEVLEIRKLVNAGIGYLQIAAMFNISRPYVSEIKNRGKWKHV